MTGERDLRRLLAGLRPELAHAAYVFVTAPPGAAVAPTAFASVREEEGLTLVLPQEDADRAGLAYDFVAARITLRLLSDLAAVGLTAAVSARLAADGISCNVIAGTHHDHLFVPVDRASDALDALDDLAREAG